MHRAFVVVSSVVAAGRRLRRVVSFILWTDRQGRMAGTDARQIRRGIHNMPLMSHSRLHVDALVDSIVHVEYYGAEAGGSTTSAENNL